MQVSGKITIWWLGGLKSLTLLRWRWLRVLYASLAEISPHLDDLRNCHNWAIISKPWKVWRSGCFADKGL